MQDTLWMRRAITLAQKGIGLTSPNPCVGAILVKNNREIGKGFHQQAGKDHAEIVAIANARKRNKSVRHSTLYVTLEPCSTHGKTPPCVDAIIQSGIARVVIGATDPNPLHAGRAFRKLRAHGISVTCGILTEECEELNRAFNHWITTGQPWVIAKIAMSLDGRIAPHPKHNSRRITSPEAIRRSHFYRLRADAIVIGAETVRTDNPRLTVRLGKLSHKKKQPWRVIITRTGRIPTQAHLLTDRYRNRTLIFANQPLQHSLKQLGKNGVTCILLEGGGQLLASAFEANLVHEIAFFIAPKLIGGRTLAFFTHQYFGKKGLALKNFSFEKTGSDLLLKGYVHRTR
ncbi:MAG: bifunctional diaminohydroxyphosphoribosylaminopyrimidine deaminase/5-amino-6-(5-phosphoribosylamino)uracil reductase RibD [Verrucomicrobiae bacterium]|nr:bifunctional diaminohydroxyphosphoribosylaminopyrimidine deaminase/5-amino-6-(5-phosphoribosylamino)uracil reductase RibD [Verrucomicrobiae bacterium]